VLVGHHAPMAVAFVLTTIFCAAGVFLNGWVAITGRYLPIGPYRRAVPPSSRQRAMFGAVAVWLGIVGGLALNAYLAVG